MKKLKENDRKWNKNIITIIIIIIIIIKIIVQNSSFCGARGPQNFWILNLKIENFSCGTARSNNNYINKLWFFLIIIIINNHWKNEKMKRMKKRVKKHEKWVKMKKMKKYEKNKKWKKMANTIIIVKIFILILKKNYNCWKKIKEINVKNEKMKKHEKWKNEKMWNLKKNRKQLKKKKKMKNEKWINGEHNYNYNFSCNYNYVCVSFSTFFSKAKKNFKISKKLNFEKPNTPCFGRKVRRHGEERRRGG